MVTTAQKAALGVVKPSLSLDFRSGVLDPRITFTRASTGTDFDSTGTIVSFSSGTPRVGFDPVTKTPLGLLMEEARTNLFLNSLLNGTNLSTQTVTVAAVQYALSFYGTGTITLTGGFTGSLVGTGAFPTRSVLVFTSLAVPLVCTVTGTVQYAQLEATSANYPGPTSFIPTAGTTGTRAIDVASMTGTNFSSWYNQNSGTFVAQVVPPGDYNQLATVLETNSGASTNGIFLYKYNSTNNGVGKRWRMAVNVSGSGEVSIGTPTDMVATANKLAISYAANNFALITNGAVSATSSSGALLPAVNQLNIGQELGSSSPFNGHISYINYYRVRLPNGQLQSLTS